MSARDRGRALGLLTATVAIGLGLIGCGGTGSSRATRSAATAATTSTTTSVTTRATTSPHAHARHRERVVHGPRVGVRQGVHTDGTYLTVTILRVLRLAHTGSARLPGTRQVGVELRIANQSGAAYDSTASGDVSLVLSAGASEPLDVRRGPCQTPLQDFESMIWEGSVRTGCVAFSVPRRARVIGVRFSPHSRPRGTLTWRVG